MVKRPGDAETQDVIPVVGGVPNAVGGAKDIWIAAPGTAALHVALSLRAISLGHSYSGSDSCGGHCTAYPGYSGGRFRPRGCELDD